MQKAIIRFKRKLTINHAETNLELRAIFEKVQDHISDNFENFDSNSELLKKELLVDIANYVRYEIEAYSKSVAKNQIEFEEWEIISINSDNILENKLVEISLFTEPYTLLDNIGNKLLLKKGDVKEKLRENEPKIKHTQFFELTPNDSFVEYSPL